MDRERAGGRNRAFVAIALLIPLVVHGILSIQGYYRDFSTSPPLIMGVAAGMAIAGVAVVAFGRRWIECLSLKRLTWLHVVRVFVEIILLGLYLEKQVPRQMTFAGANYDIIAGLTAPLAAWAFIRPGRVRRKALIVWNVACLLLLVNVVTIAVLSAPTPFQQLNFSRPNVAVGFFPFTLLPVFVVPVVLFCHLASLRLLLMNPRAETP